MRDNRRLSVPDARLHRNAGKGLMLDTIPDLDQDLSDQDDGDDD